MLNVCIFFHVPVSFVLVTKRMFTSFVIIFVNSRLTWNRSDSDVFVDKLIVLEVIDEISRINRFVIAVFSVLLSKLDTGQFITCNSRNPLKFLWQRGVSFESVVIEHIAELGSDSIWPVGNLVYNQLNVLFSFGNWLVQSLHLIKLNA